MKPSSETCHTAIQLPDRTQVKLRHLAHENETQMMELLSSLMDHNWRHTQYSIDDLKEDFVSLDFSTTKQPLVIVAEGCEGLRGEVVGCAVLYRDRTGSTRHVGKLHIQVRSDMRKLGIGKALLEETCKLSIGEGIEKLQMHVRADNKDVLLFMNRLKIKKEAVLKNQARDRWGKPHDVIIYYQPMDEIWKKMEDLNLDLDTMIWP